MAVATIIQNKIVEIYRGKDRKQESVVLIPTHKNGKHPHDKNAGIVFYVGYFPFLHLKKEGSVEEAMSNNLLIALINTRKSPRTIS